MPVPVVHIGYHKTATTWLQQRFLPVLGDGVAVFGHEALWRDLIGPSQLQFKRRRCKRYVATLIAGQPGRACVFSAERLSGNPHSGGYDAAEMADRVKAAFGEAKILILVREQVSMLVATYKQYIKKRGQAWPRHLDRVLDSTIDSAAESRLFEALVERTTRQARAKKVRPLAEEVRGVQSPEHPQCSRRARVHRRWSGTSVVASKGSLKRLNRPFRHVLSGGRSMPAPPLMLNRAASRDA